MFLKRTNARGTYHIYIDHVPKVLKHGLYKYNNTTHYIEIRDPQVNTVGREGVV